jgi:hypothetical protein
MARRAGSEKVIAAHHQASEVALAHAVGNKVEAAYRRGDLIEKRLLMMADWATLCAKPEVGAVVTLHQGLKMVG